VTEERLKIAVFVDFDNIEIGVKTTLNVAFDVGTILEAIKERGEVVTKIAYGDWTRAGDYSRLLTQHAIKMVQRNLTPGGDKNGADINLALDALEMALTHDHINAYVIVGGDSDFLSLVEKLKQYDKTVIVVGGRAFTSVILQRNCHEFIAYENLINVGGGARRHQERGRSSGTQPVSTAFPLIRRALNLLSEREVTPQLGLLKSTLLQLDSTFSEKNYGAGSFRDFAEKLAQAGLIRLNQAGRNLLVEVKDLDAGGAEEGAEAAQPTGDRQSRDRHPHDRGRGPAPAHHAEREALPEDHQAVEPAPAAHGTAPVPPFTASPAQYPASPAQFPAPVAQPTAPGEALAAQQNEALAMLRRVLEQAPSPLRWPMYVRNVKQLLRQAESGFDERRYGFGGILDLLRASQRDALLRLERDRQGVLRVFAGAALQRPSSMPPVQEAGLAESLPDTSSAAQVQPPVAEAGVPVEDVAAAPAPLAETPAIIDAEPVDAEPVGAEQAQPETPPVEAAAPQSAPKRRRAASGARKPAALKKPRAVAPKTRGRKKVE
jgi:uncharacterized LabA/DUF88 family protein